MLKKISKYLVIKDPFEKNIFEKTLLRIMDYFGNSFNRVEIPKRYFKKEEFDDLLNYLNLNIVEKIIGINIYQKFFIFLEILNFSL